MQFEDLTLDQFNTKAQAELMSKDGPDILLTTNTDLLGDANKAVLNGAFMDCSDFHKKWEKDGLFTTMLEGAKSGDGGLYIFPITMETTFIVTSKSRLEQYGLSEKDFSSFDKTVDTILKLYEQTDRYVFYYEPDITMLLDGLFDYQKGRTNLLEEETVQLLEKWYTVLEMKAERKEEHMRINDDAMFTEYDDCIFEFMDSYRLRIQYSIGHFLT